MGSPQNHPHERERQRRLREQFLDLTNVFVELRMMFLRRIGVQPPDLPAKGKSKRT